METVSRNKVLYEGKVKVTLRNKGLSKQFVVNNNGTVNLGLFFAKALLQSYNTADTPQWLALEYKDGDRWSMLTRSMSPLTGGTYFPQTETSDHIGEVKFISVLQQSNVRSISINGKTLRLSLYDNNYEKKVLAFIGGDNSVPETQNDLSNLYTAILGGQDAIIEWQMLIYNH